MTYTALGQVETAIDPVGQKTWTKYNNLGQPMIVKSKDQYGVVQDRIGYAYDLGGRTTEVDDTQGTATTARTTTIAYEDIVDDTVHHRTNNVASVQDSVTGTVSYSYYFSGARETMGLPSGASFTYYYGSADPHPMAQEMNPEWGYMPSDDPSKLSPFLTCIEATVPSVVQTVEFMGALR